MGKQENNRDNRNSNYQDYNSNYNHGNKNKYYGYRNNYNYRSDYTRTEDRNQGFSRRREEESKKYGIFKDGKYVQIERNTNANPDDWTDPNNSPHVHQVFYKVGSNDEPYISHSDLEFSRNLTEKSGKKVYRRRKFEDKTVIHWGQRKLLISEIEFLNIYAKETEPRIVVYAGAAPGKHIKFLYRMFPFLTYHLYDPAPFSVREKKGKIECHQVLFTDEIAKSYQGKNVFFISDIRSADKDRHGSKETDERVLEDMFAQQKWHELMQPYRSLLKFRFPYQQGKTDYLKGEIFFQAWAPITSTETRLIPDESNDKIEYDHTEYEQKMFYFNTVTRVALYHHSVKGEGLDHCYDCKSEIEVLRQYLIRFKDLKTDITLNSSDIDSKISEMSNQISKSLDAFRTLKSGNVDPESRKKGIHHKQHIEGKPAYEFAKEKLKRGEEPEKPFTTKKAEEMLKKHGYDPSSGKGLGANNQGIATAIEINAKRDRRGHGFQEVGSRNYDYDGENDHYHNSDNQKLPNENQGQIVHFIKGKHNGSDESAGITLNSSDIDSRISEMPNKKLKSLDDSITPKSSKVDPESKRSTEDGSKEQSDDDKNESKDQKKLRNNEEQPKKPEDTDQANK